MMVGEIIAAALGGFIAGFATAVWIGLAIMRTQAKKGSEDGRQETTED